MAGRLLHQAATFIRRLLRIIFYPLIFLYGITVKKYFDLFARAYPYPAKLFRYGCRTVGVLAGFFILLYFAILIGAFGIVPSRGKLKEINNYTASEIYSSDSVLLGKYFIENRTNAKYEDFPPYLVNALVATEDSRFYEHHGVDFISFMRVLVESVFLNNESSGGGSTITQQLAKNLFPRKSYGFLTMPVNKFREMIVAQRLEDVYTKQEILTLYFNTVPFGENCYGIEAGALRFFNKKPAELSIEESAVLVGLLKANSLYNPRTNPEKSLQRRNVVLNQMVHFNDYLDEKAADSLKQLPLVIHYHNETASDGPAPYFREYLRLQLEKWTADHPKPDGSKWNIYTDGLKIYTTIDSRMQQYAEQSMRDQMKYLQNLFDKHYSKTQPWKNNSPIITNAMKRSDRYKNLKEQGLSEKKIAENFNTKTEMTLFTWKKDDAADTVLTPLDSVKYSLRFMQTGFLAMEPKTGFIRAWVGGIDHRTYKYDHVTSKRQVGSTFKPVVYATALESGHMPCDYIPNKKVTYNTNDNWSPGNAGEEYGGYYSLVGGLTYSVNTIAAALIMQTGTKPVIDMAHKMGITSTIPNVPSIALGVADISLLEMVTAYCTFDNKGMAVKPQYLVRIEDAKGDTVYVAEGAKKTQAMSEATAVTMIKMMESVVNNGTASRLRGSYGLSVPLAGKTGTTQNNTDGWFVGYTPKLVAGAWVGAEDPRIRWWSTSVGQGAATALPIFGKFMNKVYKDPVLKKTQYGSFPVMADSLLAPMDCSLWIPDSVSLDSLGFFPHIFETIKKTISGDTIKTTHLPGAQD